MKLLQNMALVAFIAFSCWGCTATKRTESFNTVTSAVQERIGREVIWGRPSEQLDQSLRNLLVNDLTADDAVQFALLRNHSLQALYEELSIAEADLIAAGLLSNPVFDGEVRFESGGSGTALELAVVQNFLDVFFIPLRKRVASAAFDEAKTRVTLAVLQFSGEVRRRYIAYQAAEQLLELHHTVLTATEASYDLARRLHEAGNITDLELANEQALREQSRINTSAAELEADVARERLNAVMGLWGDETSWSLTSRLPEPLVQDVTPPDFERTAVANSLDLEAARLGVSYAAARLGIVKPSALFDDAGLGVAGEREVSGDWTVGPAFSLPLPLFNTGQTAANKARAQLQQAWERYTALAVQIRAESRAVHQRMTNLHARAMHYREVVLPLRHRILEETQRQYNAMQVGAFQLLQARQQEIEAGASYVATLRDFWLAQTDAEQLISGASVSGSHFEGRNAGSPGLSEKLEQRGGEE